MDPVVDLAPGAEDNPLAVELADRIRENVARSPAVRADFRALRASVLMVAEDRAESCTLRFDHGRLTVHDGNVGVPSVTFCAPAGALQRLGGFPITRWLRLPAVGPFARGGREARRLLVDLFVRGDMKVYGLLAHPRTIVLLLRVLSAA